MRKGFTLIEFIITTAILASIAVVGTVNLFNHYSRQNLELAVNEINALTREARNNSLTQKDGNGDGTGDQWGIHFENVTTGDDFIKIFSGSSYAAGTISGTYILRAGVQFTDPSTGTSRDIIFSKVTGYPVATTSITVSLKGNSSVYNILGVNESGQVMRGQETAYGVSWW